MGIELLVALYVVWNLLAGLVYSQFGEQDGSVGWATFGVPLVLASPVGFFLFLDGVWCGRDCAILFGIMFGASFLLFIANLVDEVRLAHSMDANADYRHGLSAAQRGLAAYDPTQPRRLPRSWMDVPSRRARKSGFRARNLQRHPPGEMRSIIPFR
jgi:hypothetical protein